MNILSLSICCLTKLRVSGDTTIFLGLFVMYRTNRTNNTAYAKAGVGVNIGLLFEWR